MRSDRIRKLQFIRNQIMSILDGMHWGIKRNEIIKRLRQEPRISRTYTDGMLREVVSDALRIYDMDFWRDPATDKWHLSERIRHLLARQRQAKHNKPKCSGMTAAGRIHDALAEREA